MRLSVTFEAEDSAARWVLVNEPDREEGNTVSGWRLSADAAVQAKALLRAASTLPIGRGLVSHSVSFTGSHNVDDDGVELTDEAQTLQHVFRHVANLRGAKGSVQIRGDSESYGFDITLTTAVVRRVELLEVRGIWPRFSYQIDFGDIQTSA